MRAYLIYRENVYKRIICRLQPFSRLLDIKYLFSRFSVFVAVFRLICMFVLPFDFGTLAAYLSSSVFTLFFVSRNLCVKHYASFCIFMQSKMYIYAIL